jgi:hypothetical protein
MSYEFDKRNHGGGAGPNGANRSGTAQPLGPGKATLAGGLVQQHANQGAQPATRAPGAAAAPLHAKRDIGGYDDEDRHGERPITGSVTGPSAGDGVAATVLGSTQANELASDNLFTPALVAALQANPKLSIDEVLWQLAVAPPGQGTGGEWQHPSIVQYGRMAPGPSDHQDHKKVAVLVGNQNYQSISRLYTPIAEAGAMQGALASRGYQASVHTDRTSADMTSLWGSMVGAANPGDDLVAFYGGHGCAEGLIGVNHGDPAPQDIFSNGQVSGVVSSATGKGAHIRFVMDSCHAGTAIETVREERQNELAAVASAGGEQLRSAATTGLREAKQRLISLRDQRRTILGELDHAIQQRQTHPAGARASRNLSVCVDVRARTPNAFERAADRIWGEYAPLLGAVQKAVGYAKPPPPITDYVTLGEQLKYLDDLGAAVAQHVASPTAGAAGAAGPARPGPAGGQAAK